MKRSIALAALILSLGCAMQTFAQNGNTFTMPWYSTNFQIGNPKYGQLILSLYKDYTNNAFTHEDVFADTVSADFANGNRVRGKEALGNNVKNYRGSLVSVATELATYTVMKAKDKDETWVCVWGKETDEYKDGKKASWYFNENWKFNKDGKISYIEQYNAKLPNHQ